MISRITVVRFTPPPAFNYLVLSVHSQRSDDRSLTVGRQSNCFARSLAVAISAAGIAISTGSQHSIGLAYPTKPQVIEQTQTSPAGGTHDGSQPSTKMHCMSGGRRAPCPHPQRLESIMTSVSPTSVPLIPSTLRCVRRSVSHDWRPDGSTQTEMSHLASFIV
jgi:hypothetical protein